MKDKLFKIKVQSERIKIADRDPNLHYYAIRHKDCGDPEDLGKFVLVDYWATVVSTICLDGLFKSSDYFRLKPLHRGVLYGHLDSSDFFDGIELFPNIEKLLKPYATSLLCGERIKDHYGHTLVIAKYGEGVNYALECTCCNEVICDSENQNSRLYKVLRHLYWKQQQNKSFNLSFDRIGGLYGRLCYTETDKDDEQAVEVMRASNLY